MTCREFADFLMEYLEGSLPAGQRMVFERHMGLCPPCVEYLKSYRRTVELSREAFDCPSDDAPVPEEIPEGLLRAILAARKAKD